MGLHTFSPDKKYIYTYWTSGEKNHQPLVLLPGFTGTYEDLLLFAREFAHDYLVIIPDLPGWGKSPKGGYDATIAGYAQFLKDVLQDLYIDKQILLFGHCMGSLVAIEFAYQHPQKVHQLFLISVPYMQGKLSNKMFHMLSHASLHTPTILRPLLYFFRSRLIAIPLGFFVIQTISLQKKMSIIFKNSIKQQFQQEAVVEGNWDSMVFFDFTKIQKVSMPIHLFHGNKDILIAPIQAEKLVALCENATLDMLPHSGHMPPVETPRALASAIKKYL